ncbi:inositol monophosphatase family protein [Galactobacter caseinivorans]|nr:inositol monophosphatase family protein [Galactobacter caseinivorans]
MNPMPGTENHPSALLHVARMASTAGALVLAQRGEGQLDGQAMNKSAGGDWVTDFDRRAEQAVRQVISGFRPTDVLTGEEYADSGEPTAGGYRWSIDPLDGTANFVRGIVYYATSVGVYGPGPDGREQWLAGAVTAPALGTQYYAGAGLGAMKSPWSPQRTESAEALTLTGPSGAADARMLATGFGYDADRRNFQVSALAGLIPDYANVRRLGSAALDLCLVAEGVLDAYAEFGTREWDWAAGALIAEEAGVGVTRPVMEPGWQSAGVSHPESLPAFPQTP